MMRFGRGPKSMLLFPILVVLVVCVSCLSCEFVKWKIDDFYQSGSGEYLELTLDSIDNGQVSYQSGEGTILRYARWNGALWAIHDVDTEEKVGYYTSIAIDYGDYAHITYLSENKDLKYARENPMSWDIEVVDQNASHSSIDLDEQDRPHISYTVSNGTELKYAYFDGENWRIEVVDDNGSGTSGDASSIVVDESGQPHIAYHDSANGYLRYAKWNGAEWDKIIVDDEGKVGWEPEMDLDSDGNPHIVYLERDPKETNLKYATWDGTNWRVETLDDSGRVGLGPAIFVDKDSKPHICYIEEKGEAVGEGDILKYVGWKKQNWNIEDVEKFEEGDDLQYCGIAVEEQQLRVLMVYAAKLKDGESIMKFAISWN